MASQRYVLDFGSANAGGAPAFDFFIRLDTLAAVTQPPFVEISDGEYYFDFDWATAPSGVGTIAFKVTLNGVELSDVISGVPAPGTLIPGPSAGAGFVSALTIVNRAAMQLGLGPALTDAYGSTDPKIVQLCEFLATAGEDLYAVNKWNHLIKEFTFATYVGQLYQPLPADWMGMVDQSGWNRSSMLPMVGPISSQEAQYLKARLPSMVISVAFRIQGTNITFPVPPPAIANVALEYMSSYWVASNGATTPDKAAPSANDDIVWHDPLLVVRAVKAQYLTAKGLDTTVAVDEYERRLQYVIAKSAGAPVLNAANAGRNIDRFLNGNNVPISGYGN